MTAYSGSAFRAWAVISGRTLDCPSIEINWALNTVPTANITLALGREVNSLQPSLAHKLLLKAKLPIKVYMAARRTSASVNVEKWPSGEFLLFDGDVIGVGYTRSRSGVSLSLSAVHWLARLSSGSCMSGTSHPSNASDVTFSATAGKSCGVGSAFEMSKEGNTDAIGFVQKALAGDFWEGGLQDWFICMAEQDSFNAPTLLPKAKVSQRPDLVPSIRKVKSGVKISLNKGDTDMTTIRNAISSDIVARAKSPQELMGTTFWDLLLSILSGYQLALVPRIEDALIVPFISGLRKTYGAVSGTDFAGFGYQAGLSKPWRGLGLLDAGLGGAFAVNSEAPARLPGGWYENKNSPNGLVVYRSLPGWLRGVAAESYSAVATGVGGTKGTAINPDAGKAATEEKPGKKKDKEKTLRDSLAQCMYVDEALRSRQVSISEQRFRLDLAPGSVVSVEAVGERFVRQDATAGTLYGTIAQVTCVMNAESGGAGTAYAINNIRTADENKDDSYSVANHPLWTNSFTGKGLR